MSPFSPFLLGWSTIELPGAVRHTMRLPRIRIQSLDFAPANATARTLAHASILVMAHGLTQALAPVPSGNSTHLGPPSWYT